MLRRGGVSRRGQYVGWRKSSLDNFDLAPSHLSRPTFARRCIAADQSLVLSDSGKGNVSPQMTCCSLFVESPGNIKLRHQKYLGNFHTQGI